MQTWILTALLVLSLFANGFLFAQRAAAPAPPPPPDAALVSDLQRLMIDLDEAPEWRHRLVSLGRFAESRDARRQAQQRIMTGELLELLSGADLDFGRITAQVEEIGLEDNTHRLRLIEQLILLLNDLPADKRQLMVERLRALEVHLDELESLARVLP